jgi:hypothetical protein
MQMVIRHLHRCDATYLHTERVKETFRGDTVWEGDVEVFELTGHPEAKWCYGWSYGEPEEFITILQLPPVKTANDAVKVGIAHQVNQAKKGKA